MKPLAERLVRGGRLFIFLLVGMLHIFLIRFFRIPMTTERAASDFPVPAMQLVDVREYIPPLPQEETVEAVLVEDQPTASEIILEKDDEIFEPDRDVAAAPVVVSREPEYFPQYCISEIPVIPSGEVLDRIVYPPLAMRQKLEAVVFLELYIDREGRIRRIEILRDPGSGFAEASVAALDGILCQPARIDGKTVAVRFRYSVRFSLK